MSGSRGEFLMSLDSYESESPAVLVIVQDSQWSIASAPSCCCCRCQQFGRV